MLPALRIAESKPQMRLPDKEKNHMKQLLPILLFAGCVLHVHAATINFGSDVPGTVPKGWSVFMTHQGGAPKGEVITDRTAPSKKGYVLRQTSKDQTDGRFPLLIYDNSNLKNGVLSVVFKAISERVDQGDD